MLESALAGQPESMRAAAEQQMEVLEDQLEQGKFDDVAQGQMQQSVDASLLKLKTLVEAGAATANN